MDKLRKILIGAALAILGLLVVGNYVLSGPHRKLIARAEQTDSHGYFFWVAVEQNAGRFRIDLTEQGARPLLISSYEFYQGSYPITNATVAWPTLNNFAVEFDNGMTVKCSWNQTNITWTGPRR